MAVVLVVDDEEAVRKIVCRPLEARGHRTVSCGSAEDAMESALQLEPELAIIDLRLGGSVDGLTLFKALRGILPALLGIVVTGFGSFNNALECGQAGIEAYIDKPFREEQLISEVEGVLAKHSMACPERVEHGPAEQPGFDGMVGTSRPMLGLFQRIVKVAMLNQPVLIVGETGTGKELVARSLHKRSTRHGAPFLAVTCPAIPNALFENELFGHDRGAFTDARDSKRGVFELARGGTIFLDEIGDLPLEAQAKLLRVIDQREVTRLGSARAIPTDVRILAATNVDLEQSLSKRTFRADLYWRLNAVTVRVPAVRDRAYDVRRLIHHFLGRLRLEMSRPMVDLSVSTLHALLAYPWPGNVREIEHVLRDAILGSSGEIVESSQLRLLGSGSAAQFEASGTDRPDGTMLRERIARLSEHEERTAILRALAESRGNQTTAAKRLGIDPRTLYNKMRRYEL